MHFWKVMNQQRGLINERELQQVGWRHPTARVQGGIKGWSIESSWTRDHERKALAREVNAPVRKPASLLAPLLTDM